MFTIITFETVVEIAAVRPIFSLKSLILPYVSMSLFMISHISFCIKRSFALWTFKWFVLFVNSLVSLQVCVIWECFVAIEANKRVFLLVISFNVRLIFLFRVLNVLFRLLMRWLWTYGARDTLVWWQISAEGLALSHLHRH